MKITSIKYANSEHTAIIINGIEQVPYPVKTWHIRAIQKWLDEGNTIFPEDPPIPPLTNEQLIDLAGPVLIAFIKAFAKREGVSLQQIKNAILAEM